MKLTKVNRQEKGGFHGETPPNLLVVEGIYPTKEQVQTETGQHMLGLKNLLLTYSRGFAKVDALAPVEQIAAVGMDYAKKVAGHICLHSIKFPAVEQVFRALVTAKKADLSERKITLALDLLLSAINQRQSGYGTSSSN